MSFAGPSGAKYPFDITQREHEYGVQALNQQDLDRNFCLATTNVFKWMQAARMELPWMQAGYRNFGEVEPKMTRRLLVGSQVIRLARPGILGEAVDNEVTTTVEVGEVGRTTIEWRYKVAFGRRQVATASCVMISTAGTPGNFKPHPVPDDVKALASPVASENAKFMKETLASMPKQAVAGAYVLATTVRYSDEDVNKHANHSAQARFFEDAKEAIAYDESASPALRSIAEQQLEAIVISYAAEVSALDRLEVKVALSSDGSALDVWVDRLQPNPTLVARGRMVCGGGKMPSSDDRRLQSSKL
mmetsp:Transcript_85503/g.227146  ORF Transcript_85503/g.227146 Transcript_85503/m.227146 type:complete len:303 (-) Transcript_85503:32-940(-)